MLVRVFLTLSVCEGVSDTVDIGGVVSVEISPEFDILNSLKSCSKIEIGIFTYNEFEYRAKRVLSRFVD